MVDSQSGSFCGENAALLLCFLGHWELSSLGCGQVHSVQTVRAKQQQGAYGNTVQRRQHRHRELEADTTKRKYCKKEGLTRTRDGLDLLAVQAGATYRPDLEQ